MKYAIRKAKAPIFAGPHTLFSEVYISEVNMQREAQGKEREERRKGKTHRLSEGRRRPGKQGKESKMRC